MMGCHCINDNAGYGPFDPDSQQAIMNKGVSGSGVRSGGKG